MLKQVMTSPKSIEFVEEPIPSPNKGQVLIAMKRIGICGSDIHVYHGQHPFTSYPVTQGHEVSGIIEAVGEGVTEFKPGQKVTVQPQVVCGKCHPCRNRKYNLCEELKVMGFQTTGMASEYFVADSFRVTPLPPEMSLDEGAMIEPLAVAVHAVRQYGQGQCCQGQGQDQGHTGLGHIGHIEGKDVIVLGAGPIGILVAAAAKAMGAKRVMVTDVSELRLNKALECGADIGINTGKEDFDKAVLSFFGPDRADVIYDCAGNDITMDQAIKSSRKGSLIMLVAVFAKMANVNLAVLNDKELCLNSSMMYRNEDYIEAINLVKTGKIKLLPLISAHFSFKDFASAYKYIDDNRESTMKVIVDIE